MLMYLIIFLAIGAGIKHFIAEEKFAIGIIISLSILWGLSHQAIWGFVALGELLLGYFVYGVVIKSREKS